MSQTLEARTIIDLGQQVARLRAALTAAQAENAVFRAGFTEIDTELRSVGGTPTDRIRAVNTIAFGTYVKVLALAPADATDPMHQGRPDVGPELEAQ